METTIAILTVSQLNRQVKSYLENELGIVHVEGELSNLSKPVSGHFYFTLKDSGAQIRCVYFKNRHLGSIANKLSDGQHIVASGKLSLYEARGDYQLIVEQITEAGLGALYQRFEELKNKLAAEGLFDATKKRPIPRIPRAIGIITSTTGAAIRDILSTLARRFPLAKVFVYPSEVQGAGAAQQLIKALQRANKERQCDVLLLARGGGSIEDLWAFNDEGLARHIANSLIPIVSGVGHETDFTIADFVADYRAETPTAAATVATPDCNELFKLLNYSITRLEEAMHRLVQKHQLKLRHLMEKISSPQKTIASYWQTIDYLEHQLISYTNTIIKQKQHQLHLYINHLHANNPKTKIRHTQILLQQISVQLMQKMQHKIDHLKYQLSTHLSTLHAVSPLATLDRGYAIATKENKVLYSSQQVRIGDIINIRLAQGELIVKSPKQRKSLLRVRKMLDELYNSLNLIITQTQNNSSILAVILLIPWSLFFVSRFINRKILLLGIIPRRIRGLPGIFFAPLLHANFNHIFFNSIPLLVLSNFILIDGLYYYLVVTAIITVLSGIAIWCFAKPGLHVGASGVITGYWRLPSQ